MPPKDEILNTVLARSDGQKCRLKDQIVTFWHSEQNDVKQAHFALYYDGIMK